MLSQTSVSNLLKRPSQASHSRSGATLMRSGFQALMRDACDAGLEPQHRGTEPLPSGKAFEVFRFVKCAV
jgi:hypothetical protein